MTKHVGDCVYTRISRLPTDVKGNAARNGRLRTRAPQCQWLIYFQQRIYIYICTTLDSTMESLCSHMSQIEKSRSTDAASAPSFHLVMWQIFGKLYSRRAGVIHAISRSNLRFFASWDNRRQNASECKIMKTSEGAVKTVAYTCTCVYVRVHIRIPRYIAVNVHSRWEAHSIGGWVRNRAGIILFVLLKPKIYSSFVRTHVCSGTHVAVKSGTWQSTVKIRTDELLPLIMSHKRICSMYAAGICVREHTFNVTWPRGKVVVELCAVCCFLLLWYSKTSGRDTASKSRRMNMLSLERNFC